MDFGNLVNQFTGNNPPQGANAKLGGWLQNYQNGTGDQVPVQDVHTAYQQAGQGFQPDQHQEALQYGYGQVPQQHLAGVGGALTNFFQQHGLKPQDAGVRTTNPAQMTPQDIANLHNHAQQQQPDAIKQAFGPGGSLSNPMVGMALAGALAYGASRFLK